MAWTVNGKPWYKSGTILFMLFVVLIESSFAYVQAAKSFYNRSAEDLSFIAFSLLLFSNLAWIAFGVMLHDVPILVTGTLTSIGSILVLISIYMYGEELS